MASVRLSKSRVMAGLQCHKLLWWMVHEPDAPELQLDPGVEAALIRGTRVGRIARAYVPGGVAIDFPYDAYDKRRAATQAVLEEVAPVICEASFRAWSAPRPRTHLMWEALAGGTSRRRRIRREDRTSEKS